MNVTQNLFLFKSFSISFADDDDELAEDPLNAISVFNPNPRGMPADSTSGACRTF